jgi:zinc protease
MKTLEITPVTSKRALAAWSAVVLLLASVSLAVGQATDWQQIPIPKLPAFRPAEPKRIELPNGMVIFLQEDHELPLIDGTIRIHGGSRNEPAAKTGLVDLYGEVWRTGGTKSETGDQMDDFLEVRAAKVETEGNVDSTSLGWSCLKSDFDDVFKLTVELLREPGFRADKLALSKDGLYDSISRRNDNPGSIAAREAAKLAYGANNPYAREAEYATVAAVTREDLIAWHKTYVQPNNIIIGVTGDFDAAAMEAKLRQAFAPWPKGPAAKKEHVDFQTAKAAYYYAIEVFNEAFGGGFSSRLVKDIRTKRGLAYSVGGGIGTAFDHPGVIRFSLGTKSQSTAEAIQALYEDIDNLKKQPINDEEMKKAKDSILNSFIFNFDSPDKVLHERMAYEFYGYPLNFLEKYRDGIEKTTKEDVNRMAAKYLHRDQFAVLVVGNPKDFDKPLSALGSVNNVDITIPPAPGEQQGSAGAPDSSPAPAGPAAAVASNAEGKALAAKVAESMGGAVKLKTVRALRARMEQQSGEETSPPMEITILYPDRMHLAMDSPMGPMTVVFTATTSFMATQGQVRDIPSSQRKESLDQIKRDLTFIAQHVDDPKFTFTAGGSEKIGDVEAKIVDVNADGTPIRWFVDPKTGRVLKETYSAIGSSGPFQGETDLSDWKTFDGVMFPVKHVNKQNGKDSSVVTFTEVHFNPEVDPKLFDKPTVSAGPSPQ